MILPVKDSLSAVRDVLTKSANPDGSYGRAGGGALPNDDGVTDTDVTAAAKALAGQQRDAAPIEEDGLDDGITDEQIAALNAKLDAGEALSDEEQAMLESTAGDQQDGDVTLTAVQLAEAIGWEPKDVYEGILIPLDDGQDPLPLGELKNKFQDQRRQITELETKVNETTQGAQQQTELTQMSQAMMHLTSYMQQLDQVEQNTDWAELESMDPSEAVLKRQKLWQARQQTGMKMQQLHQHEQGLRNQRLTEQRQKMIDLIPAWKDDTSRKADQESIRGHLKSKFGFNDVEITRIQDARTMAVLQDYIAVKTELDRLKDATGDALKRVRSAPKVLRDGSGRYMSQKGDAAAAMVNKLTERAKQTGNKTDALEAAKALLSKSQSGQQRSVDGRARYRRTRR